MLAVLHYLGLDSEHTIRTTWHFFWDRLYVHERSPFPTLPIPFIWLNSPCNTRCACRADVLTIPTECGCPAWHANLPTVNRQSCMPMMTSHPTFLSSGAAASNPMYCTYRQAWNWHPGLFFRLPSVRMAQQVTYFEVPPTFWFRTYRSRCAQTNSHTLRPQFAHM